MGRMIIKIKDMYLEWSTIFDGPATYGMTLDELEEYIKEEYGNEGLRKLPERLRRVEKFGTSRWPRASVEEVVDSNKAGEGEASLTLDEIYRDYCENRPPRGERP
jgi:hypothetical protein